MKLWSTLGASIKRLGRWNFNSFAVEWVSRKHRKVETGRRRNGGAREKDRGGSVKERRRKRMDERLWNCDLPSISRRNWFTAIANAADLRMVPATRLYGKNSTTSDERNAISSAWSPFIILVVTMKVDEINSWCQSH